MKTIKNGFTLVEILVCIGIMAALGLSITIGVNTMIQNSRNTQYEELATDIFNATSIYVKLSDSHCNSDQTECSIKLSDLVEKGLIDKKIYNKANPIYETERLFSKTDIIVYHYINEDITISCTNNTNYNLDYSKIKTYNWRKCK